MTKVGFLLILALMIVGCGSNNIQATNNPVTPPPTQEQLDKMPPQAAAHAAQMSDYAKAQSEQNKARMANPPR